MAESKRILIAEDEVAMAKALEMKLKHLGYDAIAVFNGEEALQKMADEMFHLLLLDLMMPVIDGFRVLEEIRTRSIAIQVIVMSNLGQTEDIQRAKEMGAGGYFIKSETPIKELVAEIEVLCK